MTSIAEPLNRNSTHAPYCVVCLISPGPVQPAESVSFVETVDHPTDHFSLLSFAASSPEWLESESWLWLEAAGTNSGVGRDQKLLKPEVDATAFVCRVGAYSIPVLLFLLSFSVLGMVVRGVGRFGKDWKASVICREDVSNQRSCTARR